MRPLGRMIGLIAAVAIVVTLERDKAKPVVAKLSIDPDQNGLIAAP